MDDTNEKRLQLKRDFGDFLDQDHGHGKYPARIKAALSHANINNGKLRVDIDVNDLREHSLPLLQSLLQDPSECINPFEEALDDYVQDKFPKTLLNSQQVMASQAVCRTAAVCLQMQQLRHTAEELTYFVFAATCLLLW